MINYYEILELNDNCTKEEIKKSYHRLCLKYHPDKCNDLKSNEKFKDIVDAYEILYNEESRKKILDIIEKQVIVCQNCYIKKDNDLIDEEEFTNLYHAS